MKIKIRVANGNYPLTYECTTACEAYGCMQALNEGLLWDKLDMNKIMSDIVKITEGNKISCSCQYYAITRIEE